MNRSDLVLEIVFNCSVDALISSDGPVNYGMVEFTGKDGLRTLAETSETVYESLDDTRSVSISRFYDAIEDLEEWCDETEEKFDLEIPFGDFFTDTMPEVYTELTLMNEEYEAFGEKIESVMLKSRFDESITITVEWK